MDRKDQGSVSMMDSEDAYDVVVVGAGPAGIGVGVTLRHAGVERLLIVDRYEVGATFDRWPREMTFLTPSFPTNSIGMLDLNSIAIGTSPGHSLIREHPTGREYAKYLRAVARHFELPLGVGVDVRGLTTAADGFVLNTSQGKLRARYIVWAAGEYQYPHHSPFPGAELCRHTATVASWRDYSGSEAVIIGGYESALDAGIHLASLGKKVTILGRDATWDEKSSDPSRNLSIYTRERLETIYKLGGDLTLVGDADVVRVESFSDGYRIDAADGRSWFCSAHPLLATGFLGGHRLLDPWFARRDDDYPLLTEEDESALTPGLFLVGPAVRHDPHIFCFIYKFRQRFAVVVKWTPFFRPRGGVS
jgi:putative flavoprotein involved in K+ transport